MKKKKRRPYSERTDLEKIKSNWKKISGLIEREEWSGAVVRAATAAEIAANLVVREELEVRRSLEKDFVDHLLIWANGIQGKYQKLVLPTTKEEDFYSEFRKLQKNISEVNKERNSVAHQGQFKKEATALRIVSEARTIINCFVKKYHHEFELNEIKGLGNSKD